MRSNINIPRILSFSLLLFPASFSGCTWLFYDRYQEFNDEFRNSTKSITRMVLTPLERRNEVGDAYIIFEREKSPVSDKTKAYCVVSRSSFSFAPVARAYIKIDDNTWEITLQDIVSEQKMSTETSGSAYAGSDSTSVFAGSTFGNDTKLWIDDKFTFAPTDEMIEHIEDAENMMLRFYFGPVKATYRIHRDDLKLLKRALTGRNPVAENISHEKS